MKTGAEYIASLADGRATYFEGERVEDIAAHKILGQSVALIAGGYDRLYLEGSESISDVMSVPKSAEELKQKTLHKQESDMLAHTTYSSLMTLLTAADRLADQLPDSAKRIRDYVDWVQAEDLRITQCITDAKGDRSRKPLEQDDPDAYLRVVERRDDGVVIRGAKLHISGASLSHEMMTIPTKAMRPGEEDYSIACMVPVNAEGVKIVNTTYAPRHEDTRDFPISRKSNVPEGFVIFDNVFVPNERIFLDGVPEHAATFAHSLGLWERLGGLASMADGADRLVGFAQLIAEANGTERVAHIRDKIVEMMIHATMVRAALEAAISNCHITDDGEAVPNELYTNAGKYQGAANYKMLVGHLHDISGGSILTAPSMGDLENEDVGHLIRKYMSTKQEIDGKYRLKLFHAVRDLTADTYGGWVQVTNMQSGGGLYAQKIVTRLHYDIEQAKAMALETADISKDDL